MAKYLTRVPAFIGGVYYDADVRNPAVIEIPAGTDDPALQPSLSFEPLDADAKAELEKLASSKGVKKKFKVTSDKDADEGDASDVTTMAELQTRKPKRASDKDAI